MVEAAVRWRIDDTRLRVEICASDSEPGSGDVDASGRGSTNSFGTDGTPRCTGGPVTPSASLQAGGDHTSAVAAIECTFPDFSSSASVEAIHACVAQAFGNEEALLAMSKERDLRVR
jgi:hypothetical protein